MKVSQLLYKVRMDLGDTNKAKVSDYDLMNALNGVLELIANALNNISSNILSAEAIIPIINHSGELPPDFQSIITVENGWLPQASGQEIGSNRYRILGNIIYASRPTIKITYKRILSVDDMFSDVPLPLSFNQLLIRYIKVFLEGGFTKADSEMTQLLSRDVYRLAAGREVTEVRQKPIFVV